MEYTGMSFKIKSYKENFKLQDIGHSILFNENVTLPKNITA